MLPAFPLRELEHEMSGTHERPRGMVGRVHEWRLTGPLDRYGRIDGGMKTVVARAARPTLPLRGCCGSKLLRPRPAMQAHHSRRWPCISSASAAIT
jgi:hypothetical protein